MPADTLTRERIIELKNSVHHDDSVRGLRGSTLHVLCDMALRALPPQPREEVESHLGPTCDKLGRHHIWQTTEHGHDICVSCKIIRPTLPATVREPGALPPTQDRTLDKDAHMDCYQYGKVDGPLPSAPEVREMMDRLEAFASRLAEIVARNYGSEGALDSLTEKYGIGSGSTIQRLEAGIARLSAGRDAALEEAAVEIQTLKPLTDDEREIVNDCAAVIRALKSSAAAEPGRKAKPLADWHEDFGPALWWKFPVEEPPYSGSPLDTDWPGYHTHWTPILIPDAPSRGSEG